MSQNVVVFPDLTPSRLIINNDYLKLFTQQTNDPRARLHTYLRILARCKEYRHTEKSHSIQEVREVHGLRRILDVRGDRELRQSLEGL